ncbi:HET-domain-containing protein [Hypoxylon sp. FL0890]|nr:HET-domain-containing protein [Hypoxylon sp. FL0890]
MWCFNSCLTLGKGWIQLFKGGHQSKYSQAETRPDGELSYFSYSEVPLHDQNHKPRADLDEYNSSTAKRPKIIRLLRILPTREDGLLACYIRSVELNVATNLNYDALSYTWGPTTRDEVKNGVNAKRHRVIICNNRQLLVTENLFNCLTQLEENGHYHRDLWIDAICINQDDLAERSEQVSIMADIYRSAKCVIVWLGTADEFTQPAWELIKRCNQLSRETLSGAIIPGTSSSKDTADLLGDRICPQYWRPVALFFGRTWFTRAWVVQELVLARETIVLCGKYIFDWDAIVSASELMAKRASASTLKIDPFGDLDGHSLSYKNPAKLAAIKRDVLSDKRDVLLHSLIRCRTYEASNDHDKIYSVLGLANCPSNGRHNLYPDYKRNVAELYTDFAEYLLEISDDLHLLAHAEGDEFRLVPGLPTWVPDWSVKKDLGLRITGYARYEAAGKLPCFKEIPGRGTLVLRGFEFDTISRIGETKAEVNRTKVCTGWLDLLDEIEQEFPGRNYRDAFWRTLLVDTDPSQSVPITRPWEDAFNIWIDLCAHCPSPEEKRLATEYETSFTHSLNLRLFRTASGHLGCGTLSCKKGDSIWIIQGSRVPLILRPTQQEDPTTYNLVGGTYLHGFMQGEALDGREFREVTLI